MASDLCKSSGGYTLMKIRVRKTDAGYDAEIIEGDDFVVFKTSAPQKKDYLQEVFYKFGFHQRDIFDAFDMANGNAVNVIHPLF